MIVKICGITNQDDAAAAVRAGAGALGFNFYPRSPRYVGPGVAGAITTPAQVLRVGVFVNEPPARVAEIVAQARLDVAQLHGDETAADVPAGVTVWKAFRVDAAFSLDRLEQFPADTFLLDSPSEAYGGSGHPFDWTRASGAERRILLAGGLDAGNVQNAIRTARPWGVDACSRLETSPGVKDHARMQRFIELALTA